MKSAELRAGRRYAVCVKKGGFPWTSEGRSDGNRLSRSTILSRFEGWSGGKAIFRAERGKWRFSMTRFEVEKEYKISQQ